MTRRNRFIALGSLAILSVALAAFLNLQPAMLNGEVLRTAALHTPLGELREAERSWLFRWLLWDYLFAVIYTVFYACMLRELAVSARRTWLDVLGRTLSWIVAIAIVFDLCENLVLWSGASIGATSLSPWLPALAWLKFLSSAIFLGYVLLWLLDRTTRGPAAKPASTVS